MNTNISNDTTTLPILLILRPTGQWDIIAAELVEVESLGRYMLPKHRLTPHYMPDGLANADIMLQVAQLCDSMREDNLYNRCAGKKKFPRQADFWVCDDNIVKKHTKRMADQLLIKALTQAFSLNIPILYTPTPETPLHIDNRLSIDDNGVATPIMRFTRNDDDTIYRLLLRINGETIDHLSQHSVVPLCHEPGYFIFDKRIVRLAEGFNAKLLAPFAGKEQVVIPRRTEKVYFQRFILKNVASAEVHAEGFDIKEERHEPHAAIFVERTIDYRSMLTLYFEYGGLKYTVDSQSMGKVTLHETAEGFCFVRFPRDRERENHILQIVRQTGTILSPQGNILFDTTQEMVEWLRCHHKALQEAGISVVQPSDTVYYIGALDIEQEEEWHGDWLQTKVNILIDGGKRRIPFTELRPYILRGEQHYMLSTGEQLLIPQEWLARYKDLLMVADVRNDTFRRHYSQLLPFPRDAGVRDCHSSPTSVPPHSRSLDSLISIPEALRATLRPYQETGFRWLWDNFLDRTGCCLSDEMGLGKTLQTIALILKYKETCKKPTTIKQPGMLFTDEEMTGQTSSVNAPSPREGSEVAFSYRTTLVVAPASVVHNWCNELQRFAPSLLVCNYTGNIAERTKKQQALMRWDVVVTSYGTLAKDIDLLATCFFGIAVYDESQAFKTSTTLIHEVVKRIQALHAIALSGTPVENGSSELWSLMNVLNPNLLGEKKTFLRMFVYPVSQQIEKERNNVLRQLITPYFLKRTKDEVADDLPERQDELIVCPMTLQQQSSYAEELSKARNLWLDDKATQPQRQAYMLVAIQRLRQIANGEGKLNVVMERLELLRPTSHKVLIFSEYVTTLEQVALRLRERGWHYEMLTGKTQKREEAITRFQKDADRQFFLVSLKAGGVGLNLTAADYIMLIDPWWNLAAEEQAIARAHRIGQHNPVFVYRFVAENTLEQQILTLQDRKQSVIDSIMPFVLNLRKPSQRPI